MRLTIVQSALHWEQPDANRLMFAQKLAALRGHTDLVVLPEMFSTGFSMNAAALAEPMDGPTVRWMRAQANALNAVVTGSFICSEGGRYFNRLIWAFPDGRLATYDKRHLFALSGEHEHYTSGQQRTMVEWQGWCICPLICYDLRFPVWSRNTAPPSPPGGGETRLPSPFGRGAGGEASSPPPGELGGAFDLLIYVANWPSRRAHHWRSLLMARAIENQCFVAAVNIFGKDGNGLDYSGDSAVIDFAGHPICQISGQEGIFTANLSLPDLQTYRQQLPFLQDADAFRLC